MRAIWKGSISFGLINIPVSVYPASEERGLEFHLLHKKDLSPIRFARICRSDKQEIPYSEIVKAYEYDKGTYVVMDEQDFKHANAKKTSTIDVLYFTDISEIAPMYYEKPYYLEPSKQTSKAYKLLWEALLQSNKIGIGTFVFRNREHIGAIFPLNEGLLLMQMRYHAEILAFEGLELPQEKPNEKELSMAMTLIEQLSQPFKPASHHDTYTEDLMKVIENKLKGKKEIYREEEVTPSYKARDLMGLLQESLKKNLEERVPKKKSRTTPPSKRKAPSKRR